MQRFLWRSSRCCGRVRGRRLPHGEHGFSVRHHGGAEHRPGQGSARHARVQRHGRDSRGAAAGGQGPLLPDLLPHPAPDPHLPNQSALEEIRARRRALQRAGDLALEGAVQHQRRREGHGPVAVLRLDVWSEPGEPGRGGQVLRHPGHRVRPGRVRGGAAPVGARLARPPARLLRQHEPPARGVPQPQPADGRVSPVALCVQPAQGPANFAQLFHGHHPLPDASGAQSGGAAAGSELVYRHPAHMPVHGRSLSAATQCQLQQAGL
mmetsp:Transcript_6600/g.12332  ORF Transcript_6600/g.12332 Transcript_6600/m.12332 type:complete len:265 (+) Transcript_6600:713-1507(+)